MSPVGSHRKKLGGSGETQLVNKVSSGWRGVSDTDCMIAPSVRGSVNAVLGYLRQETGGAGLFVGRDREEGRGG